jgi:hypothetical protein
MSGSRSGTTQEQEVYAFGFCKRGQLGIGTLDLVKTRQPSHNVSGKMSVPQKVWGLGEKKIIFLTANGDHSGALDGGGQRMS